MIEARFTLVPGTQGRRGPALQVALHIALDRAQVVRSHDPVAVMDDDNPKVARGVGQRPKGRAGKAQHGVE